MCVNPASLCRVGVGLERRMHAMMACARTLCMGNSVSHASRRSLRGASQLYYITNLFAVHNQYSGPYSMRPTTTLYVHRAQRNLLWDLRIRCVPSCLSHILQLCLTALANAVLIRNEARRCNAMVFTPAACQPRRKGFLSQRIRMLCLANEPRTHERIHATL